MKNLRILVLVIFAFSMMGFANAPKTNIASFILTDWAKQMKQIHSLSLDLAGVNLKQKQVDLVITDEQINILKKLGFTLLKVNSDATQFTPDSRYQTPVKIESALKQYAAKYSNLAQLVSIGKSLESRDIWAMKLTKDVSVHQASKPHILFNSMHHAREVMTSEVGLDIIDQLLTQYGKDPKITHWMDSYEIWVIPMFNVDGNNMVWTHDSMWRKNARGGYGVDINRNYPYAWNSCDGSSSSQNAQDYHGASAGSEPETKVMMNFANALRPVFEISYHSYSELVIYPYGCPNQNTPTKVVVEKIGRELASKLVSDNGKSPYSAGTAPELLYAVDGGDIDWLYHEAQVIPFVIELNSSSQGFQPSYEKWRDISVKRQREGWQYLLARMDGSSIHGQVIDQKGKPMINAKLHIVGSYGFTQDYLVNAEGYFDVILNQGTYTVSVQAPSMQTINQTVTVESTRVELPIAMTAK